MNCIVVEPLDKNLSADYTDSVDSQQAKKLEPVLLILSYLRNRRNLRLDWFAASVNKSSCRKQLHELFCCNRSDAYKLQVLFHMRALAHAHQRGRNSWRRTHKLYRCLRVAGQ